MSGSLISADGLTDNISQANTPGDSTLGEKVGADLGNFWNSTPSIDLFHYLKRNADEEGPAVQPTFPTDPRNAGSDVDAMAQERGPAPVRPTIGPYDATQMANQQGATGLIFDAPISPQSAQTVIDQHLAAQQRAATIENYHGGALSKVGSIATGMLVGLADPLNLAAMAIPIVPEGFVAARLASAAGAFERTMIRGAAGAVNGAAGMAALIPYQIGMSKADYNDYTYAQALGDIAFGAAGGALGHAVLGGIFGHVPTPETRMASLRASVGQVLDGRPVDVAGIIDHAEATNAADNLTKFQSVQQRILAEADAARAPAGELPPDRAMAINAAQENIASLHESARGLRGDIADAQAKAVEGGMDADTSARLEAVNEELGGVIPKARRAALEQERDMLTQGRGTLDVSGGDPLEQARTASQVQGMTAAAERTEAQAAKAEQDLGKLQAQAKVEADAADAARASSTRSERIAQAKQDSQESVLQNLMEREVRKYAANIGTELGDGEAATIAREIRTAQPGEAQDIINDHLNTLAKRSTKPDVANAPQAIGNAPVDTLRAEAQGAADDMAQRARAPAPDPTRPDAEANKALVEKAPQVPAETDKALAEATQTANDLRQQVQTEIDAGRMHPDTGKGDLSVADMIEGNGKALQAAASCLLSKGM